MRQLNGLFGIFVVDTSKIKSDQVNAEDLISTNSIEKQSETIYNTNELDISNKANTEDSILTNHNKTEETLDTTSKNEVIECKNCFYEKYENIGSSSCTTCPPGVEYIPPLYLVSFCIKNSFLLFSIYIIDTGICSFSDK